MRNVVIVDDAKDATLHPKKMMQTLTKLLKADLQVFLRRRPALRHVVCPGCGSSKRETAFKKLGFAYQTCSTCLSIYMSPRPSVEALREFHDTSKAMTYSMTEFTRQTGEVRDSHIFLPRVDWLVSTVRSRFTGPVPFADVQPKYVALLKRFSEVGLFGPLFALDASPSLLPSLKTLGYSPLIKEAKAQITVATAFEVIERVYDTQAFVRSLSRVLSDDGLLFLTTRAGSGFDLQVLWENADNIFPMIHMNLLSVEGTEALLKKAGFDVLELSTPGRLDVEIVRDAATHAKDLRMPRFISYLIRHRGAEAHEAFQEFLQQYKLSSHLRVVARKKGSPPAENS